MRMSRKQVAENRKTILSAATRLFREKGFDAVSIGEIMGAAGLTHGGFYGYFENKDALIAEALAEASREKRQVSPTDFDRYVARYLSPKHRDNRATGCPVAALAAEAGRTGGSAQEVMTGNLARHFDRLTGLAPGDTPEARRRAAVAGWSAMVGALILARASDDPALSEEILAQTRAHLLGEG